MRANKENRFGLLHIIVNTLYITVTTCAVAGCLVAGVTAVGPLIFKELFFLKPGYHFAPTTAFFVFVFSFAPNLVGVFILLANSLNRRIGLVAFKPWKVCAYGVIYGLTIYLLGFYCLTVFYQIYWKAYEGISFIFWSLPAAPFAGIFALYFIRRFVRIAFAERAAAHRTPQGT